MDRIAENSLVAEELSRTDFDRLRAEWDDLALRSGRTEPFHRHAFLRIWLDNFAHGARLRLFVARAGGKLLAALPLLAEDAWMYGVPVRRLRAPANVHSNRFDALCERGRDDALSAVWSHLRATGGFDVLEIPDVPIDGAARRLLELAGHDGLEVGAWESMRTPFVPLQGGFEQVAGALDGRFKQNLRRRRRKLEQRGKVEVERVEGGRDLEVKLEEAFSLERAGWKGRRNTAIGADPGVRGFYAELARQAALEGELALYFLRLDGRPVAVQYGLQSGGTYFLPKTAYDEDLGDCSPGQLLTEEVLRDCCRRGLAEFDFLGPWMSWKADWSERVRAHHWLYVFGPSARAGLARELKFSWAPAAKEMLRWKR